MIIDNKYIKRTNLLYVEDEDAVRDLTSGILKNFVKSITIAKDGQEGLELFKKHNEIVDENSFDLVVTDINMPRLGGLEMLQEIRKIDNNIPTVITTAHDDPSFLKKSINLKVKGYVSKPLNMSDLVENIAQAVESKFLRVELENSNQNLTKEVEFKTKELQKVIKDLEDKNSILTYQATHDNLTTLSNRLKLNEELDKEILREHRYKHGMSLLMLDIDDFKKVNDTYGHNVGDIVLKELANILKNCTRETDLCARWGGEEFIVVLPETPQKAAAIVSENIRKEFENFKFDQIDHNITVSIGLTEHDIQNDTKEDLIGKADIALYKAKNSGKNKVVIYEK